MLLAVTASAWISTVRSESGCAANGLFGWAATSETDNGRAAQSGLITTTPAGLEIGPGSHQVHRDAVIGGDVVISTGASVEVVAGATLTFSGDVQSAPTNPVFKGEGAVRLVGQRTPIYAEWWGAKSDNQTVSNPAFQKAADALVRGGTIKALTGSYKFDCSSGNALVISGPAPVNLEGSGKQSTIVRPTTNCGNALIEIKATNQSGHVRDLGIVGDQLRVDPVTASAWTGLICTRCGVSDLTNLWIAYGRVALNIPFFEDGSMAHLYLQGCSYACMILGGGPMNSGGAQNMSLTTISDVSETPTTDAVGTIVDSGFAENRIEHLVEAGLGYMVDNKPARGGILIQNSSQMGHRPEGVRLWDANVDANTEFNIAISSAWNVEIHDSELGQTFGGPNLLVTKQAAATDVEGVKVLGSKIRAAAEDDVLVSAGCNVTLKDNEIYAAGAGGRSPSNAYAAIHVGRDACGLMDISGNMLGTAMWANATSTQAYSVVLDPGALDELHLPAERRQLFAGRLMIVGNVVGGNRTGTILDRSAPPLPRKMIVNNLAD